MIFAALFELVMTHIFTEKYWMTLVQNFFLSKITANSNVYLQAIFRFELIVTLITIENFLLLFSASFSGEVSSSEDLLSVEGSGFLFRNSALLLAFLLKVVKDFFFFDLVNEPSPLVAREIKKEPTLRVKLKVCPLLVTAWQKSMHWEAKSGLCSLIAGAAIFTLYI